MHFVVRIIVVKAQTGWDQILARFVHRQSTISSLVCSGQACTTSTQLSGQISFASFVIPEFWMCLIDWLIHWKSLEVGSLMPGTESSKPNANTV